MGALLKAVAAVAAVAAILLAGVWLGGHPSRCPTRSATPSSADDRGPRAELQDAIESDFYRKVDGRADSRRGRCKGMVEWLDDRFSTYFTPKETKQFQQSVERPLRGRRHDVDRDKRGLRVLNVFEGSPAKRGGVRKGDLITEVNGQLDRRRSRPTSRPRRSRGRPGTTVRLQLVDPARPSSRGPSSSSASAIEIPIVDRPDRRARRQEARRSSRLASFTRGRARRRSRKEIDELVAKGAEGIVLDLRGNGGGLLNEAVLVGSASSSRTG